MVKADDGRGVVTERVRELVEALRTAPAVQRFRTAEEQFRGDAELSRMQAEVRRTYGEVVRAQSENRHDPRLFQEVRDGQARLQKHPLVVEFVAARAAAQDLLRQTNVEMSAILGLDIGVSVGRAGAC